MKKLALILFTALTVYACQIEDDNAPTPEESFIKYYGELAGYEAKDIEFLYDSSGFIVFGNITGDDGTNDYTLIRISQDGTYIDSTIFSFDIPLRFDADGNGQLDDVLAGSDDAGQVEVFDGGFVVVGTTSLNNSAVDILDVQVATVSIFDNDYNNLLDTIIALSATQDIRSGLDLLGTDVIETSDGGFLIMGSIEVDRGGGATDFDYYLLKVGTNDDFEEIIGITGEGNDDILVRGFEKANGNLVLIGYSSDPSSFGENGGFNGLNVTYSELTSQGKLINSTSYGFDNPADDNSTIFNEVVHDAIQTSSGYAIAGTTTLSTDDAYAFFMTLTGNGIFISGDTLTSGFGYGLETRGTGIVQTRTKDYVILGTYPQFDVTITGLENPISRAGEAMFMRVDQSGLPVAGSETNYGTENGNDSAVDALALPDGKIVVLANVDFGGGIQLISLIKTDDNGQLEN